MKALALALALLLALPGLALAQSSTAPGSSVAASGCDSTTTCCLAGAQTVAGAKTFSSTITSSVASGSNALVLTNDSIICLNSGCTYKMQLDTVNVRVDMTAPNAGSNGWRFVGAAPVAFQGTVSGTQFNASTGVKPGAVSLGTCAAGVEGIIKFDTLSGVATAAATRLCYCSSDGASVYTWRNIVTGTSGTSTTCAP